MKRHHKRESIETLCGLFGMTKQAYYQKQKRIYKKGIEEQIILESVQRIRKDMPRLGTRKLLVKLLNQGLHIGRDALFDLLKSHHLLVRRKKN